MATIAKTVIATGCSSGLGFEVVKQLLTQSQPYNFLLGARDPTLVSSEFKKLNYDTSKHAFSIFPLELADLRAVKKFAGQVLSKLGEEKVDYVLLNAALVKPSDGKPGPNGSKWAEAFVVNSLSQHYLLHLLHPTLLRSPSARVVIVSSGALRAVTDPSTLPETLLASTVTEGMVLYGPTKFTQLLNAHWWRRKLNEETGGKVKVVATSPGVVPGTGLGRNVEEEVRKMGIASMPDAKSVAEEEEAKKKTGAQSILAAFTRDDFPEDQDQIFLTSWGEWWSKDVIGLSLDKALQDKWSPSEKEIEKDEKLD